MVASPSGSVTVPDSVAVSPSGMVRLAPASTVGGALTWTMVISTRSELVALWLSVTLRVRVMVVLAATSGATKVAFRALWSAKETDSVGWSWVHR